MGEEDMAKVAGFIDAALKACEDEKRLSEIRKEVREFLVDFPLYKEWIDEMEALEK
jgi:glycine/serine hydroxymethyltransferase